MYPVSNILHKYRDLVRNNAELVSASEWGLSNLTWLLPDRFNNSELTIEGVHALLGLLSLYHESIISESPSALTPKAEQSLPWIFWLGAIQQVEVLYELAANATERSQGIDKFGPLSALEAVKALMRLLVLRRSSGNLLTDGGLSTKAQDHSTVTHTPEAKARAVYSAFARFRERHCLPLIPRYPRASIDEAPESLPESEPATPFGLARPSSVGSVPSFGRLGDAAAGREPDSSPHTPRGPRNALWWDAPSLNHTASAGDGTLPFASAEEDADPASPASRARTTHLRKLEAATVKLQGFGMRLLALGELLHILRPLIYTLALRKFGRRSWRPWFISLGVEAASAALIDAGAGIQRRACRAAADDPTLHHGSLALLYSMQALRWSPSEVRELIRRRLLFLYYFLRSPFFDLYTRPPVEKAHGILQHVPLVGSLSSKALEILLGIQALYTYTSAS
ncbi:hypothetical protein WJX73_000692 [Symbiochloris irregularis]|uniref:Peroxisomal membrane protein PEX16 n=1 Tax=Symbiochloris irregularis TaxID=706552 RepID=A0AAW1PTA0_9CHLO